MTDKLSIRPGDQLRAALAIDAERRDKTVAGLAVEILAAYYGQQPPERKRNFDSPEAARAARAKVAKPGRRPKKS